MANDENKDPGLFGGEFNPLDFTKGGLVRGPVVTWCSPEAANVNPEYIAPLDKLNRMLSRDADRCLCCGRLRGQDAADRLLAAHLTKPDNG